MASKENFRIGLEYLLLELLVSWFIFHSFWFCLPLILGYFPYRKFRKTLIQQKRNHQLLAEFLYFLQSLNASVYLGYSMDQAFLEGEKELDAYQNEVGELQRQLQKINRKRTVGESVEQHFLAFASERQIEEILIFAQVLCFLQKNGGDSMYLINQTSERIRWIVEVHRELLIVQTAKRMEVKIMLFAPAGMLVFMNAMNPEYMSIYYQDWVGYSLLLGFLLLYGLAAWMSYHILQKTER